MQAFRAKNFISHLAAGVCAQLPLYKPGKKHYNQSSPSETCKPAGCSRGCAGVGCDHRRSCTHENLSTVRSSLHRPDGGASGADRLHRNFRQRRTGRQSARLDEVPVRRGRVWGRFRVCCGCFFGGCCIVHGGFFRGSIFCSSRKRSGCVLCRRILGGFQRGRCQQFQPAACL